MSSGLWTAWITPTSQGDCCTVGLLAGNIDTAISLFSESALARMRIEGGCIDLEHPYSCYLVRTSSAACSRSGARQLIPSSRADRDAIGVDAA